MSVLDWLLITGLWVVLSISGGLLVGLLIARQHNNDERQLRDDDVLAELQSRMLTYRLPLRSDQHPR